MIKVKGIYNNKTNCFINEEQIKLYFSEIDYNIIQIYYKIDDKYLTIKEMRKKKLERVLNDEI